MQYIDVAQKIQMLASIMDDWALYEEKKGLESLLVDFDSRDPAGKELAYKTACLYYAATIKKRGICLTLINIPK